MKRVWIAALLLLTIVVSGCDMSMGTNNPFGIKLGKQEESQPAPQKQPVFAITVNDLIQQVARSKGSQGDDVFKAGVLTKLVPDNESIREHQYRNSQSLIVSIFEDVASGNVTGYQVQVPAGLADDTPTKRDYYDYVRSGFEVLLQVKEPYLITELTQYGLFTKTVADKKGYDQETIHYNNAYCTFQVDIDKNASVAISAVSEFSPWKTMTYFDGENYHLYLDDREKPVPYTTDNLQRLALGLIEQNKPLPAKLREDLAIPDTYGVPAEETVAPLTPEEIAMLREMLDEYKAESSQQEASEQSESEEDASPASDAASSVEESPVAEQPEASETQSAELVSSLESSPESAVSQSSESSQPDEIVAGPEPDGTIIIHKPA